MPRHEFGPEDDGAQANVSVGDTVTVRLDERRTAGYRWKAQVDESALQVVDDRYEPPGSQPGAHGTRVLTFDVLRPGRTRLHLVSHRRWEQESSAEYRLDLSVAHG
jgi:predicted secreted protein